MQQFGIIVNQIAVMTILAFIGWLAGKTGYLPEKSGMYVSSVVIRITAPALIVSTMASYDFTPRTITDGIWIGVCAFVFILLSFAAGSMTSSLLKLKDAAANIYKAHSMFGNVGYLALPLFKSIFGEKGLVYAVFFVIVHDTLIWTLGVYLLNKHKGNHWKENLKHLFNANTVSFALGLLFALINLHTIVNGNAGLKLVYNTLYNTLNPLGNTTLALIMLFIGLALAESSLGSISGLIKKYPTFVLAFFKLLVMPVLAFIILLTLGKALDPFVRVIVVLELSMPCATIIPALAAQYGSDSSFAADNVIVTTILSMVTLPLILYFLNIFGG
ncbi:MAG: AEC family transporter [Ruminiclostridium sp.]|nr:AEC family transporter [Ruminiclostridium sp.]